MNNYVEIVQEIHKVGSELTSILQIRLVNYTDFFVWISKVLDPRYAYLLFFPLLFPLNRASGLRVLWTAAVVEWINHVTKWLLFGERTYWWVQENKHVWENSTLVPLVKQFSITCETGPGSPSGHVMIMGAVLYVFLNGLLELQGNRKNSILFFAGWSTYITTMILVATSRVFIAAHFPHQCVAGLILGIIFGFIANKIPVSQLTLKWHILTAVGMLSTALTTYYILLSFGVNPNWTLPLAKKWCVHPEWVHLNTTPFYMLWRYTATITGIGLGLYTKFYKDFTRISLSFVKKVILASVNIVTALFCARVIPDVSSVVVVYCCAFVIHTLIPVLIIGVLPWLISSAVKGKLD